MTFKLFSLWLIASRSLIKTLILRLWFYYFYNIFKVKNIKFTSGQRWRIRVNFGARTMATLEQRKGENGCTNCTWMLGVISSSLIKGSRFCWRPVINERSGQTNKFSRPFQFILPPGLSLRVGQEPPPSAKEWRRTNTSWRPTFIFLATLLLYLTECFLYPRKTNSR